MLKGKNIIILSLMRFDGLASTNFTIAKYLARDNEVFYIEHPLTIKDYLKIDKNSVEFTKRRQGFKIFSDGLLSKKVEGVNIFIGYPVLSFNGIKNKWLYDAVVALNEQVTIWRLKKLLKKKRIQDYIFINAYDFKYPNFHKKLIPQLSVYYCVDPIPHYDALHGVASEAYIVKTSDVVICTSKALYEEKKKINAHTYFVPNGSDIVDAGLPLSGVHKKLQKIDKPIIGYIGAIERRIDYNLLDELTKTLEAFQFVFVGPYNRDFIPDWFFQRKNIHYVEPIPYNEVPLMVNSFDICIIPFKKDKISRSIFPLKLFEYLSLGKPVVVTDFNTDLEEFTGNMVYFTDNAPSFANAIKKCLHNNTPEERSKRIQVAKQNTWQERVNHIKRIISDHLELKISNSNLPTK